MADSATARARPLSAVVPRHEVCYRQGVYLTEARTGPINVLAWWTKDADGKSLLRAVMTNLPACWRTYRFGRRRMAIETVFRDWQSQGFDLEASGVTDPERFSRLLIVVGVLYLWLVCVGRYVVKKGWRRRVDRGPARAWRYSLIVDYRGYGQSTGRITSETQLHADAEAAYAWLCASYPEEQIVLYGRSIGSGLTVRLAAQHQPGLLILESAFASLAAIARRRFPWLPPFLLKYPLRNQRWIGRVRCPIVMIHGTDDPVVPYTDSLRLSRFIRAPLQLFPIPGAGHADLVSCPAWQQAIAQALD